MRAEDRRTPEEVAAQRAADVRAARDHYQAGRLDDAAGILERTVAESPGFARGWILLGAVEGSRGRLAAAAAALGRGLDLAPDDLEARHLLAKALAGSGRVDDALGEYRDLVARAPGRATALTELGALLQARGDLDEALRRHREAVAADPGLALAHNNLGAALRTAHRPREAVDALRRAAELDPARPEILLNLGNALKDLGALEEAIEVLRRAVQPAPEDARLFAALGAVLARAGRAAEAIDALERAVALAPADPNALGRLIREREQACDWDGVAELAARAARLLREGGAAIHPFVWLSLTADPAEQRLAAERWSASNLRARATATVAPRAARQRIHVGYLSADFHDHATAHLIAEVIELHDRRLFQISAYSSGPDDGSAMRRRLETAFDRVVDIAGDADAAAARRIASDGVDILVDLKGWTEHARTDLVALRPAPVVVSYLGYPGTLGAGRADYLIGDHTVTPLADSAHYAERLVLLPTSYQPNDRQRAIGPAVTRAASGLPERGLVLCAFNQLYKFTRPVFEAWCAALAAAPDAVLWVLGTHPLATASLRREMAARGVAPERLIAAPRLPLDRHLARLAHADLFVDTFPYNAHTSASDALWAGVPVLTRMGGTFASRVAASLSRAVGLDDLVTDSLEDYRGLLLALVADRQRLAAVRARLAAARPSAPLFDSERHTRALERAYLAMWARQAAGLPPDHIVVDDPGR